MLSEKGIESILAEASKRFDGHKVLGTEQMITIYDDFTTWVAIVAYERGRGAK